MRIRHREVVQLFSAVLASSLLTVACAPEEVPEPYRPTDAHDAYRHGLAQASLIQTALGGDWLRAADSALASPTAITTPFKETTFVESSRAVARGYRFHVSRGQRVEISVETEAEQSIRLFIDLFRVAVDDSELPVHVATAGEGDRLLWFEPRHNADYIVRVQPELLREAHCTVLIRNARSLEFPVDGYETDAIGSGFGAPRDAGRRTHHGIDIFARRHTPVVATSEAVVRRVDDWRLGGRIVWLWDEKRELRLYYAHLQSQDVEEGQRVKPGDPIGTVGNSGNAKTTAPHLHFGIYAAGVGPVNPLPFVHQPRQNPPRLLANTDRIGRWVRTIRNATPYFDDPKRRLELRHIDQHTPLYVRAATGTSYLVRLPNEMEGYLNSSDVESMESPLTSRELGQTTSLRARPNINSPIVRELSAGTRVKVMGKLRSFQLIREDDGSQGWLAEN